jgi:hydroxymethylpyrimidine pyrophosphatase-like HAD family hydrolase
VKEVVKPALTKRFLNRFRDSDSSSDDDDIEKGKKSVEKNTGSRRLSALTGTPLEQTMPADALLPKANVEKVRTLTVC